MLVKIFETFLKLKENNKKIPENSNNLNFNEKLNEIDKEKIQNWKKFPNEKIQNLVNYFQKINSFEKKENDFSILKTKNIFTKYELVFYNELKELLKNTNFNLLSKVRLADLVEGNSFSNNSNFYKIFNKINRKHIDFLIADTKWKILVLIELDWYSHNYKNTIKSDKLKEELFESLWIPLLRYKNWYSHNFDNLKNLLCI